MRTERVRNGPRCADLGRCSGRRAPPGHRSSGAGTGWLTHRPRLHSFQDGDGLFTMRSTQLGSPVDQHVRAGGLDIAPVLHRFVEEEALPGSGLDPAAFWDGFGELVRELAPRNRELLARRDELQRQLDGWDPDPPGRPDQEAYAAHLREIGYLLDEPGDVAVTTSDVDDEVARIAGPQLVVPLLNARFATNAVNARWGSLYDALYGSDLVPREGDLAPGEDYNQVRGDEVIARGRAFLDEHFPLDGGSHADTSSYAVDGEGLAVTVKDDVLRLADPAQFVGRRGDAE